MQQFLIRLLYFNHEWLNAIHCGLASLTSSTTSIKYQPSWHLKHVQELEYELLAVQVFNTRAMDQVIF